MTRRGLIGATLLLAAAAAAAQSSIETRRAEVFTAERAQAPFSWEPDLVEVLASGDLALSTGLVKDPAGAVTARFNSIWQRQADGRWLVIFDKGGPP